MEQFAASRQRHGLAAAARRVPACTANRAAVQQPCSASHYGHMAARIEAAVRGAVARSFLVPPTSLESHPAAFFYDLDAYRANMASLRATFPPHWHHATAVKTCPLSSLLSIALAEGHGAECASIGEVLHALSVGFAGPDVVFDSPCKTVPEIQHALEHQVMLNVDNMQELARVRAAFANLPQDAQSGCVIGLRINPLVGSGKVANLSVSTRKSKFGVICPAGDGSSSEPEREAVVAALVENDFVNAIHVHTGSGGMTLAQMAQGAAAAADLAIDINRRRGGGQRKIEVIDIGGGLPVTWGGEQEFTFNQYAAELRSVAPSLFDGTTFRRVVTEMGAMMNCKYAFYASVCEVTKPTDGGTIAMIHNGSDMFMRACYAPQMRAPHPVRVFAADGTAKKDKPALHDIAGPLCFAGDVVVSAVTVPQIEPMDIIVLEEAGGNTHSLRTTHCSRRSPPIYGLETCEQEDDGLKFVALSSGASYEQVLGQWN
jgi:diaminopimelate decarboxylase